MDAKKFLVLVAVLTLVGTPAAFAGQTTISGPMRCYMPDHLELQAQGASFAEKAAAAPSASGVNGAFEVKQEEKTPAPQEMVTQTQDQGQVTVYTVCAK